MKKGQEKKKKIPEVYVNSDILHGAVTIFVPVSIECVLDHVNCQRLIHLSKGIYFER
jgi:hypothetical protein